MDEGAVLVKLVARGVGDRRPRDRVAAVGRRVLARSDARPRRRRERHPDDRDREAREAGDPACSVGFSCQGVLLRPFVRPAPRGTGIGGHSAKASSIGTRENPYILLLGFAALRRRGVPQIGRRARQPVLVVVGERLLALGPASRRSRGAPLERTVAAPVVGAVLDLRRAANRVDIGQPPRRVVAPRGLRAVAAGLRFGPANGRDSPCRRRRSASRPA